MYTRATLAPAIALFLSIAACSPGDVTGPANEEPEPPPLTNVLYDVTVTLKSLEALGDCDRNEVVFGVSVGGPGEFAYSIWVGADGEVVRRVETIAFGQRGTGTASKSLTVPSENSRPNIQLVIRQKRKNPAIATDISINFR